MPRIHPVPLLAFEQYQSVCIPDTVGRRPGMLHPSLTEVDGD